MQVVVPQSGKRHSNPALFPYGYFGTDLCQFGPLQLQAYFMKALTYHGSKDVRVETVPDPRLQADDDIILRVTATAICGSDLHIYRGKIPSMETGDILGHEFMGIVEDAGPGVTAVQRGDRVVIPFTISCGECFFCNRTLFAACENTNPGRGAIINKKSTRPGAALFGYSHLYGGYAGGQAELVRVPKANVGPLVIPDSTLTDEQVLFLSDILPTGYQAAVNAEIGPGSTVAIFGAGPVGLLCMAVARALGASRIIAIDIVPERLAFAKSYAATDTFLPPKANEGESKIEFSKRVAGLMAQELGIEERGPKGVDLVLDASGAEVCIQMGFYLVKIGGTFVQVCVGDTILGLFGWLAAPGLITVHSGLDRSGWARRRLRCRSCW